MFNTFYNTNVTKKWNKNHTWYLQKKWNNTKFPINYELLSSPSNLMFETKVQTIAKVQMEHFQNLIVDLNITH